MDSASLCSLSLPCSTNFNHSVPHYYIKINNVNKRVSQLANNKVYASAAGRDAHDDHSGHHHWMVDENMIVLRKRIHEMKMVERNYEPPENWMDWEKKYYTSYDSLICDAMGVLQAQLMNTRPCLALGMMALIAFSVPTSTAVVCFHFMEISKAIFVAGIQHMA